jgi:hypothetical protein
MKVLYLEFLALKVHYLKSTLTYFNTLNAEIYFEPSSNRIRRL